MQPRKQPRSLRELVLADLVRAQRLITRVEDELDPQFRIATPEGEYWIAMTLAAHFPERARQMQLLARFMAWKASLGFTTAAELEEPDAMYAIGVMHKECAAALMMSRRFTSRAIGRSASDRCSG